MTHLWGLLLSFSISLLGEAAGGAGGKSSAGEGGTAAEEAEGLWGASGERFCLEDTQGGQKGTRSVASPAGEHQVEM